MSCHLNSVLDNFVRSVRGLMCSKTPKHNNTGIFPNVVQICLATLDL